MWRFKLPFLNSQSSNEASEGLSTTTRDFLNPQQQPCLQPEPETLSASVDLEDIIEDYDGASHKSRSASILSFLVNSQLSQSYFSISGAKDDETSFYSALQDGFSLDDEFELAVEPSQFPSNDDSFWTRSRKNGHKMLPRSDFQVNWYNVNYRIQPAISLSSLWSIFDERIKSALGRTRDIVTCRNVGSLDIEGKTNRDASNSKEPIKILQNVSGSFKSGELTGVMGPSGAGKTSLLNFLSRRREDGFTGQYYINNVQHRIRINSIPQEDRLPEYFSVRENLLFASRLKNTHTDYDHQRTIERVSDALGLTECLDTRTKNISGGQLKRLSIAQELLSKPDILILDEPTSGLDSSTCFKTLLVLKNLVKTSKVDPIAVVVTIHQPQHELFDLFDRVYVMATGGMVIYDGPPNKCVEYVEKHAGIKLPNEDDNPATFLIEIASGEYGQEPIEALAEQVRLDFEAEREKMASSRVVSPAFKGIKSQLSNISKASDGTDMRKSYSLNSMMKHSNALQIDHRIAKASSMNRGSFWLKTRVLTKRCWTSILRDPKQLIARIIFHFMAPIFIGLLMGTEPGRANACPHYQAEFSLRDLVKDEKMVATTTQDEFLLSLENVGTIFMIAYSLISANVASSTLSFTLDIQQSLKEYHNGWYSMPSYLLARLFANMPTDFILPTLAVTVGYVVTGQYTGEDPNKMNDAYRILLTALAVSFGSMIGQIMGMITGVFYIGHVTTALFVSQGIILAPSMLSGIVVRVRDMSKLVEFVSKASFFRHTFEIAFLARWGWNVCNCDPSKISGTDVKLTGVNDELKSFVRYWMSSGMSAGASNEEEVVDNSINNSSVAIETQAENSGEEPDLFQAVAKQISYFNTYGVDVKSCDDLRPYQLMEFQVKEDGLLPRFATLVGIWLLLIVVLIITVKLVIRLRTSL